MKYIVNIGSMDYPADDKYYAESTKNKVDYLIRKMNSQNVELEIISCSPTRKNLAVIPTRRENYKGNRLINAPTISLIGKISSKFQKVIMYSWLFFFLIRNTKRDETIILYHSNHPFVYLAKKIKKLNIVLEVEEIFANISGNSSKLNKEMKQIHEASAYIVASETILKQIDSKFKPHIVFNGGFEIFPKYKKKSNGKINIVYAGAIYPGLVASRAVNIAKFLSSDYSIHIIGWGESDAVSLLLTEIEEINKVSKCKVSYDGFLSGDDLNIYLQNCDIGISPQVVESSFAESCFPSKLALYLANNLRVVASYSESVKNSQMGKLISFCKSYDIEDFANEITKVSLQKDYDSMGVIEQLNNDFEKDLNSFLLNLESGCKNV